MQAWTRDIRQALRILRWNPGFSLLSICMLALGIGACTAIFTVVNSVLLRPLPFAEPGRLVRLFEVSDKGSQMNVPEANFVDWKAGNRSFEAMTMYGITTTPVNAKTGTIRAQVAIIGDDFFEVFKVHPLVGTVSGEGATISYGFWQRAFGGGTIQGATLRTGSQFVQVAAVMPAGFSFPSDTDIWMLEPHSDFNPSRSAHNWSAIGRLRPGVDALTASKDIGAIAKRIHSAYADVTAVDAIAVPLQQQVTESVSVALPVLLAAVGILLLVAAANVTNLLLAHLTARGRELAIRTALGANRSSIARLFLAESMTITIIGGLMGMAISKFGVDALLSLSDGSLPRITEIHPDVWVLAFSIGLSLLVGLVLGIIPIFRSERGNLNETLKQSGRSETGGIAHPGVRRALVVVQVAMTVILLVTTGLLGHSFAQLLRVNLGFQTENRVAFDTLAPDPSSSGASQNQGRQALAIQTQRILDAILSLPGITAAGATDSLPLGGGNRNGRFLIEGRGDSRNYWPEYCVAGSGYFEAMGIPLIRGRYFDKNDSASTPEVAVISQDVADKVWPGEDPVGKRINFGNMDGDPNYMTIVGVVGDVRNTPEAKPSGSVYVHFLQRGRITSFTYVVRTAMPAETIIPVVSAEIRKQNPELSLRTQTLDRMFSSTLANRRFNLALVAVFGGSALMLALLGIYGMTTYSVTQRRQEIGIRIALGAQRSDVTGMFVAEGLKLSLIGVVLGIFGALAASRVLSSLLFGVQPTDAAAYAVAVLPMLVTAIIASHVPASRAARVDPMVTLQDRES